MLGLDEPPTKHKQPKSVRQDIKWVKEIYVANVETTECVSF